MSGDGFLPFGDDLDPAAAFWTFHNANPHVYEMFSRYAFEAIKRGRTRFSARMIWERMRWYTQIEATDAMDFKLNDHYPPYYARMFMAEHPEYEGLFETRER